MKPLAPSDPGKVGSYRTVAVLGSGAMGRVLLGRGSNGQQVAVKRVHSEFTDDEGFRSRFRREVKAARKVVGFHTANVLADKTGARIPWMATEYVPGPTLREAVDACGPFSEEAVLRLAAGLADALSDIHCAGLVHRDLKPSNIILTDTGLKVIDFGIARAVDASTLTGTGTVMGSYAFMSPEQILADEATPASDVFALGAVLGFAATGCGPFDATTVPAITHRIINEKPQLDGISNRLSEYIGQCLVKDPNDRPAPDRLHESGEQDATAVSGQPWPQPVHALVAAQRTEADAYLEQALDTDTVTDDKVTVIPEEVAQADTRVEAQNPAAESGKRSSNRKPASSPEPARYVVELAEQLGVDLATVTGRGPGGEIQGEDVRKAASRAAQEAAQAKARDKAARVRAENKAAAAKAAQTRLQGGSTGTSETSDLPSATPLTKSNTSGKQALEIVGVIAAIVGVLWLGSEAVDAMSAHGDEPGSDTTTTAADDTQGNDAQGNDDPTTEDQYDPTTEDQYDPTTETVDATAGCAEAFDTVEQHLDVANTAMDNGNTNTAIDAFRDMESDLRTDALEANDTSVEHRIEALARDSGYLGDALAYNNDSSYQQWRTQWKSDRDNLNDICYG